MEARVPFIPSELMKITRRTLNPNSTLHRLAAREDDLPRDKRELSRRNPPSFLQERSWRLPFQSPYKEVQAHEVEALLGQGATIEVATPDGKQRLPVEDREDLYEVQTLYGKTTPENPMRALRELSQSGVRFWANVEGRETEVGLYGAYNALTGDLGLKELRAWDQFGSVALSDPTRLLEFQSDQKTPVRKLAERSMQFFSEDGRTLHPFEAWQSSQYSVGRQGQTWFAGGAEALAKIPRFEELMKQTEGDLELVRFLHPGASDKLDLKAVKELAEAAPDELRMKVVRYGLERIDSPEARLLSMAARSESAAAREILPFLTEGAQVDQLIPRLEKFLDAEQVLTAWNPELAQTVLEMGPEEPVLREPLMKAALKEKDLDAVLGQVLPVWKQQDASLLDETAPLLHAYLEQAQPGSLARQVAEAVSDDTVSSAGLIATVEKVLEAPNAPLTPTGVAELMKKVADPEDRYQVGWNCAGALPGVQLEELEELFDNFRTFEACNFLLEQHLSDRRPETETYGENIDKLLALDPGDADLYATSALHRLNPALREELQSLDESFQAPGSIAILHREMSRTEDSRKGLGAAALAILDSGYEEEQSDFIEVTRVLLELDSKHESTRRMGSLVLRMLSPDNPDVPEYVQSQVALARAYLDSPEARDFGSYYGFARRVMGLVADSEDAYRIGSQLLPQLSWFDESGLWAATLHATVASDEVTYGSAGSFLKSAFAAGLTSDPSELAGRLLDPLKEIHEEERFYACLGLLQALLPNLENEQEVELVDQALTPFLDEETPEDECLHGGLAVLEVLAATRAAKDQTGDVRVGEDYLEVGDVEVPIRA